MKIKRLLPVLVASLSAYLAATAIEKQPVDYVDLFIGTSNSRWMLGLYA